MSRIDENAPKHCAEKKQGLMFNRESKLFFCLFIFLFTFISLMVTAYLILHPTYPEFSLKQARINHLSVIAPSTLNSSLQLILISTNPNKRAGIFYDQLLLYASYKAQHITAQTSLPSFYQDHQETNFLSASLVGNEQPVDPYWAHQIQHDQGTGQLTLEFKVIGTLRLKTGTWLSQSYPFTVNCVTAFLPIRPTISTGTLCSTKL